MSRVNYEDEPINKDSCASCIQKRPGRTSIKTYCMAANSPYYKQPINDAYLTHGRMTVDGPIECGSWLGRQLDSPENLERKEDMP